MVKKTQPNIIEFVTDPQLLGLSISPAQEALLRSIYGLPLTSEQMTLWTQCTGRQSYPGKPFSEGTIVCGARAGKDSRIAVPTLLWEAVLGGHKAAKGERLVFPLIAQDARATRVAYGYARDYLTHSPVLRSCVKDIKASEIELTNGSSIICFSCTQASLRGYSIPAACLDEVAQWKVEGYVDTDLEIQTAVRRGMIGFANTRLLKVSTPFHRSGIMHSDFDRYWGQEDAHDVLVWKASSMLMHPGLSEQRLERERRLDPTRFAREYEAEWISDLSAAFDPEAIDACVVPGRKELPPMKDTDHFAFVDPSAGARDLYTCCICVQSGEKVLQVALRYFKPPFSPADVTQQIVSLLKSYGIRKVTGDRYAGQFCQELYTRNGIDYEVSELDRSSLFLECIPLINAGRVELLDHPETIRELKMIERRVGPSGKQTLTHPSRSFCFDDRANALAGAAYLAGVRPTNHIVCTHAFTGELLYDSRDPSVGRNRDTRVAPGFGAFGGAGSWLTRNPFTRS
jgi:hypothetical protein